MSIKVRYLYSASVVIESPETKILCDPWFTQGAYDGSWYIWPELPIDPVDIIGPVRAIYISHLHPDHYDPVFLRRYLSRYPDTPLLIGETQPPLLLKRMKTDGFQPVVATSVQIGKHVTLSVIPSHAYPGLNIDTALVFQSGVESVIHMNDCHFDAEQWSRIKFLCPDLQPTIGLFPYSWAGSWPHMARWQDTEGLLQECAARKKMAAASYQEMCQYFNPRVAVPVAGTYWLNGPQVGKNPYRGSNDATEMQEIDPRTLVLADGGKATIDAGTLTANEERREAYPACPKLPPFQGYRYEELPLRGEEWPLVSLLRSAYDRALEHMPVEGCTADKTLWFGAALPGVPCQVCLMDILHRQFLIVEEEDIKKYTPRFVVWADPRLLFGLLTRLYVWNVASVGSLYEFDSSPMDNKLYEFYTFVEQLYV